MVSITIDNFKDSESMVVYELPKGSSVLDLKTEIEATEGIPIGHQRLAYLKDDNPQGLVYWVEDLQDNEDLDWLIWNHFSHPIISLLQPQIRLHVKSLERQGTVKSNETSSPGFREDVIFTNVDLDKPIRASLPRTIAGEIVWDFSSLKLCFLNLVQVPINLLDIDQTFSYYGICNGHTMHIIYETGSNPSVEYKTKVFGYYKAPSPPSLRSPDTIILQAKYDWDGKIMHPFIRGLPLKRNTLFQVIPTSLGQQLASGWLYGTPFNPSESMTSPWLSYFTARDRVEGYLPESLISRFEENTEEDLETTDDMLDIPPLPLFQFPPAQRMTFHMPISDKGHSFLKMMANYELLCSPVDPTQVTFTLLCSTHDIWRISSVSLFIETPETTVLDVKVCDNEAHREEIHIDKEVTENRSRQTHFDGLNIGTHGTTVGFQGGTSKGHSIGSIEKGSRVSRRKVDAGVYNNNTVFWNLKAPTTRLDEDGLTGKESITFTLTKKPVEFKYKCRVTHSRDGVEKTAQRVSKTELFRPRYTLGR